MSNELTTKIVDTKESPKLFDICPYCKEKVAFLPYKNIPDIQYNVDFTPFDYECNYTGIRQCSNPNCEQMFSVSFNFYAEHSGYGGNNEEELILKTYNLQTLPEQDKCVYLDSLPENIAYSFIESQKCYHNACYIASAIMIRKTLEEICNNFDIKGSNLEIKINAFLSLPEISGKIGKEFDILREFGNDGAHQLKVFDEINEQAVERALKVLQHALEIIFDARSAKYQQAIDDLERHKKSEAKNLPF